MNYDGQILIDTKINTAGVSEGTEKIEKQFEGMSAKTKAAAKAIKQLTEAQAKKMPLLSQSKKLGVELDKAKAKLAALQKQKVSAKNALELPENGNWSEAKIEGWIAAHSDIPDIDSQIKNQEAEVSAIQKKWDVINEKIDRYDQMIREANASMNNQKAQAERSAKAAGDIKKETRSAAIEADKLGQKTGKVSQNIGSASKAMRRFGSRMREIVSGALFFNIISSGLRVMTNGIWQAISAQNNVQQSLANLTGAAYTAAAPLINVLANAFVAVANAAATAFSYISRIYALLTGKTLKAVAAQGEAMGSLSASAGGVADNVKKAKRALAGFDEIQKLSFQDNSGGGGGGGGLKPNYDFGLTEDTEAGITALVAKIEELIEPLKKIDFSKLLTSIKSLGDELGRLGDIIGDSLEWLWFNVLVPLAGWTVEEAAPAAINVLTAAFRAFNEVLIALQPLGEWLWNNILQPLAEWTGGTIVDFLNWIADGLSRISDWISRNQSTVQTITVILGSFALAWKLVNDAIKVFKTVSKTATLATSLFSGALKLLTSPTGLVVAAIAALIAVVALLALNWDEVKEFAISCWDSIKKTWEDASNWFNDKVVQPVKDLFSDLFDTAEKKSGDASDKISKDLASAGTKTKKNFTAPTKKEFTDLFGKAKGDAKDTAQTIVDSFSGAKSDVDLQYMAPTQEGFTNLFDWLKRGYDNNAQKIVDSFSGAKSDVDLQYINPTINGFTDLFGFWKEKFDDNAQNIVDSFSGAKSDVDLKFMVPMQTDSEKTAKKISGFFKETRDAIKTAFENAASGAKNAFSSLSSWFNDNVITPIKNAISSLGEEIDSLIAKFKNAWNSVGSGGSGGIVSEKPGSGGGKGSGGLKGGNTNLVKGAIRLPASSVSVELIGSKALLTPLPYLSQGTVTPPRAISASAASQKAKSDTTEAIQDAMAVVMEDMIKSNLAGQSAILSVLREILEAVLGIEIDGETLHNAVENYKRKMAVVRGE